MKGADSKLAMLNSATNNALILLRGQPEPGSFTNPETGFFISEQNPDDSISDQITTVYGHLNNIILVINQHGTLLNNLLQSQRSMVDGRQILDSLRRLDDQTDDSIAGSALQTLKQKLGDLNKDLSENNTKTSEVEQILKKLQEKTAELDLSKATYSATDHKVSDAEDRMSKKINELERRVSDQVIESNTKNGTSVSSMIEKMNKIEKDLAWKINDCTDLLKLRPSEAVIESNLTSLEQKLRAEMNEIIGTKFTEAGISHTRTVEEETNTTSTTTRSTTSFNDIYEKMHLFENQYSLIK